MIKQRDPKKKSSTVPQRQSQRSEILVPCVNCEEFISMDQIDNHTKICQSVTNQVKIVSKSSKIFEESNYKLSKLKSIIQTKSYKCAGRLCRIIELVLQIQAIGQLEESSLIQLSQEIEELTKQQVSSLNQALHVERLHSLVLQRIASMQEQTLQRNSLGCQSMQNFYSQQPNRSYSKVSLGSTNTTQQRQLKNQITNKIDQCNKIRQESLIYQSQIDNINSNLLKQSNCFSPEARMTYITKFSSQPYNQQFQKSDILTHISNSVEQSDDFASPKNGLQRQFYTQCLNIKMKYPSTSPCQKLPVSILWTEAQRLQLPASKWEQFIGQAMEEPYMYLDPRKVAQQQFQATLQKKRNTPFGYTFPGAFTFGESNRTEWVKKEDDLKSCDKFEKAHRAHESRTPPGNTRLSNLPQDERLKPIKSPNPAVGTYNIHRVVVVDEKAIDQEAMKKKFTIQSSIGRVNPSGELDLHPNWSKANPIPEKENPIGPTSYNPKIQGKTQPLISFGYKETYNWAKDGPAPNIYYNSETFSQFKTNSTWKSYRRRKTGFGSAPKLPMQRSIDLGPGQYPISKLPNGSGLPFSKSEREYFKTNAVPAPGTYDSQQVTVEKTLIQKQKEEQRRRDKKTENEIRERKMEEDRQKRAETFGRSYIPRNQRSHLAEFNIPGPGTYEPQLSETVKNIRMPKDKRKDMVTTESKFKPGPGTYEQELLPEKMFFNQMENDQGQSLRPDPNSEEQVLKYSVPAPGTYEHGSSLGGPKYSMRLKNERLNINANPGPGHYEPDTGKFIDPNFKPPYHYTVPQTPTPAIGKGNRSDPVLSKFRNIGPGSYQSSTASSGSRISMPKAARFPVLEKEDVGPGSYKIPSTIGLIPKYHFEKYKERIDNTLNQFEKK